MKKNVFDTQVYLNEARERFSGANGWDSNFVDQNDLSFDANGAELYTGADGAAMGQLHEAPPLQLTIVNPTGGALTCILFGANINLNPSVTNFGSAAAITVTPDNSISYYQVLQQSMLEPFRIGKMRVQSTNTSQVIQTIQSTSTNYYGQSLSDPISMTSTVSAYQNQLTITESTRAFDVTGNTYLSFSVLANTTVIVTFFTQRQVNLAHGLNGISPSKSFLAPSTGVKPLLIKTGVSGGQLNAGAVPMG